MKKSTLNILTLASFLGAILSYALGHGELLDYWAENVFKNVFMVCLIVLPILLLVRVVSAIFLPAMKGSSVQNLELVYAAAYLFLTEKARSSWAREIEVQRDREKK